jgi:hypothetical protein
LKMLTEFQDFFRILGFLRSFWNFWRNSRIFGNIREIFGFFGVLGKVAEFGHPGSTGII